MRSSEEYWKYLSIPIFISLIGVPDRDTVKPDMTFFSQPVHKYLSLISSSP